jgi:2-oxoglutarate dehydrogenase E2 component (dihydrolipoamide succinyltransferase)
MQPLSTMRQRIAEHMVASKRTSPHVTTVFEFDFGRVAKHRETHKAEFARGGVNLTWLAYLTTATAQALRQYRAVNSEWAENAIRLKPEVNIGIAVALGDDGLVVPVIRNADELNLMGVARQIQDLAQRARNKQLQPSDMQGGTFTITNHGASGSLIGTPIINQPNAAILGFGAIEKRVKVIEVGGADSITIRPCAFVSLSFDHRILDGATADAFVATIKRTIENW